VAVLYLAGVDAGLFRARPEILEVVVFMLFVIFGTTFAIMRLIHLLIAWLARRLVKHDRR
jgi:hypothetical protein